MSGENIRAYPLSQLLLTHELPPSTLLLPCLGSSAAKAVLRNWNVGRGSRWRGYRVPTQIMTGLACVSLLLGDTSVVLKHPFGVIATRPKSLTIFVRPSFSLQSGVLHPLT